MNILACLVILSAEPTIYCDYTLRECRELIEFFELKRTYCLVYGVRP